MHLPLPLLPEEHLLQLSSLQREILEVIKLSLVNERLNLTTGFDNPHALVAEDIGVRSKLDLIEDLLGYDDKRREDIADARAQRAQNSQPQR